jgi:hypothetical protein
MKALAYALLLLGTVLVAVSRAQVMVVSSQTAVDADDNELSPSTAAVLATTRDSLSPADQNMLQEMLQDSEGVTLIDENGDSLEGEIEAEADSLAEAAEEAEDEAEEEAEADHSVVAAEIPGTAQSVHLAEEDELDEAGETVEAEDLDAADEEEEENDVEAAEAEADEALAEDASFLQIDQTDEEEDDSESEEEEEAEENDEQTEELVETDATADEHILSVPEAEAHHMLLSVQEPAAAFLQVTEELEASEAGEDELEAEAEAEISDSAEQFETAEDAEAQVSDSADNGNELDQGWGEEFSDTDPYSFLQIDEQQSEGEGEEELLYADSESEDTLVDAPLNAVTSTSQTTAQIHAELDEAANAATASEFQIDTAAAAAAPAHSDAAEAEADSDTSEEMEVNEMGEGVWEDIKTDVATGNPVPSGKRLIRAGPAQPSVAWEAVMSDTAETRKRKAAAAAAAQKPATADPATAAKPQPTAGL